MGAATATDKHSPLPRIAAAAVALSLLCAYQMWNLVQRTSYMSVASTRGADRACPQCSLPTSAAEEQGGIREVFATLWASEYRSKLLITEDGSLPPSTDAPFKLEDVLQSLQDQGIGILFTSFQWSLQQQQPGKFNFRLMDYVQRVVCESGTKLAVVLDANASPPWVSQRFPDGLAVDAKGVKRGSASFFHVGALQLVHHWQDAVLARLRANNATCIHSVQPSFNNEYETKYTQEQDAPQDYGPAAVQAFRSYFRGVHGGLWRWNERWGTNFTRWSRVVPPAFSMHHGHFNNTLASLHYWDWQHLRHLRLHAVHEASCQRVAAHGFRCIQHFPEFLTSGDAIYASGTVFTLAASPWLDYIVVDSNFWTVSKAPNSDVRVVQLLLAAMRPFHKPVFFEGAFERISDPKLHRQAVRLTSSSGAYGMGFTNWLGEVNHTSFFRSTLRDLPAASPAAPPVAILTPYRSYLAYKGSPLQPGTRQFAPNDFQQDLLFACLDVLERELPSLDGLQVFGVPTMLLPALQNFQRVYYVEPDVLLSGDARTIDRIQRRAAALGVPLRDCVEKAAPPIVLDECCPSL